MTHWLFIWLGSIVKHADQTPAFSHKPINSERAETKSCHAMINNRVLWKQFFICFYFTGYYAFTTFYFVSLCWTVSALVLWYAAFPLSSGLAAEKSVCVCVCYVPQGEKPSADLFFWSQKPVRRHAYSIRWQSLAADKDLGREYCCNAALVNDLRFCAY